MTAAPPRDARFEVPEDVVHRDVGGETMILHLEAATYFGLDEVGTRVWQLLLDGETIEGMTEALGREFDAEPDRIRADVEDLVGRLVDRGLIRAAS